MLEPFDRYGRMDVNAYMESFMPYLQANKRTNNTVFHVSLNPSPEDKLTDEQLREIACEYMERTGYDNLPISPSNIKIFPECMFRHSFRKQLYSIIYTCCRQSKNYFEKADWLPREGILFLAIKYANK